MLVLSSKMYVLSSLTYLRMSTKKSIFSMLPEFHHKAISIDDFNIV